MIFFLILFINRDDRAYTDYMVYKAGVDNKAVLGADFYLKR